MAVAGWLGRRWRAGKLSLVLGSSAVIFALVLALLPQNGCGVPALELFRDHVGVVDFPGGPALYQCQSIARSSVPIVLILGALGMWYTIRPGAGNRRADAGAGHAPTRHLEDSL